LADLLERLESALRDRYTIESEIGRGGMASVFLARDLKHHRSVAIKVLHPELAAAVGSDRFLREIDTVAGLTHPHILPLHDSGEADGFLFFVMPYIEGESLRERLDREKQLPLEEALRLTHEMADALAYAHRQSLIHRDVKPANILLSEGHATVADFGVAAAIGGAEAGRLTTTGLSVGTPAYMSPEQGTGGEALDERTDIYGLACVLYEMLAGHPPFMGSSRQEILARHLMDPVPSLMAARSSVPGAVDRAVRRALAKAPIDRFATATDFSSALRLSARGNGPSEGRSIVVLPFTSLSLDPQNEYFSDGLSEDLINALTHIKDLRVAARTSAFSFKGRSVDARVIGQELNVGTVLEGSVRKAGNRLRITAELTNADTGYHIWSEQYDRDMGDVFAVQDEITQAIVDALKVELMESDAVASSQRHTDDLDAYHLYLKGRYYWNKSDTESFWKAIENYQAAIEVDPAYARAYVGLADAYASLGDAGHSAISPRDAFSTARVAVRKALELDDGLSEAYASLGHLKMHEFVWEDAERAFKRAIALNPNHPSAFRFYAFFFAGRGRSEEAIAALGRALDLDPVSLGIMTDLGVLSYLARDYDRAIRQYEKVLEMDPGFTRAYVTLGSAYAQKGMHTEAIETTRKAMDLTEDRSKLAPLGRAYGLAGMKDEALEAVAGLKELSKRRYVTPYAYTLIYASLGDRDTALSYLQRAFDESVSDLIYVNVDPFLDALRGDPRFTALLQGVGFEAASEAV
jgi:serine/threonine-protein kinase